MAGRAMHRKAGRLGGDVASAYQILVEMEQARTEAELAAVLRKYADAATAIENRGYRTDYDQLRNSALISAERVSGRSFCNLLSVALSGE